jgi:dUTP pyrophosphatase
MQEATNEIIALNLVMVKKLDPEAVVPARAKEGDAGYDLVAIDDGVVDKDGFLQYRTGLAIQPPRGYHSEVFPRSSISKYDLILANSIGLVDSGYRGEILVRFKIILRAREQNEYPLPVAVFAQYPEYSIRSYKKGDKIAQLVFRRTHEMQLVEVEELGETQRGGGGFGSSGS